MPEETQTVQNPYDTSAEQKELEALQKELEDAAASAEGQFAEFMAENTSPELEELFFENRMQFYAEVLKMQNAWVENNLNSKARKAQGLSADIQKKQAFAEVEAAQNAFLQKHPEANIEALMAFFAEELRPREQAELNKLPPLDFFEALYQMFQAAQGNATQSPKLPQQIQGSAVDAGTAQVDMSLPQNRI